MRNFKQKAWPEAKFGYGRSEVDLQGKKGMERYSKKRICG